MKINNKCYKRGGRECFMSAGSAPEPGRDEDPPEVPAAAPDTAAPNPAEVPLATSDPPEVLPGRRGSPEVRPTDPEPFEADVPDTPEVPLKGPGSPDIPVAARIQESPCRVAWARRRFRRTASIRWRSCWAGRIRWMSRCGRRAWLRGCLMSRRLIPMVIRVAGWIRWMRSAVRRRSWTACRCPSWWLRRGRPRLRMPVPRRRPGRGCWVCWVRRGGVRGCPVRCFPAGTGARLPGSRAGARWTPRRRRPC